MFCKQNTTLYLLLLLTQSLLPAQTSTNNSWAYDSLHISKAVISATEKNAQPIIIAVIDDGFRLSHNALKDFIYQNPKEVPGNQVDDDGNGYIDDVNGWDISDRDNQVLVAEGRDKIFFHGTYIASIITEVARRHYGEKASEKIKIMPVKVLSDFAEKTYVKDGYKGIRYAMENGAAIICTAWSGGDPSDEELNIISAAVQKGILLIGSVGNLQQKIVDYPAKAPEVLAVSGVDRQGRKQAKANYGGQVDISAPAVDVLGAHPEKDNAYILEQNTSPAAALVAGAAGILLATKPELSPAAIKEALLNTATPLAEQPTYAGKLGAGKIHLERALAYISNPIEQGKYHSADRPKGTIVMNANSPSKQWQIQPPGGYHGFRLEPDISRVKKPDRHRLAFFLGDSLWNSYTLSKLPAQLFVPAQSLTIKLQQKKSFKKEEVFKLRYWGESIDSTTLYCDGVRYFSDASGRIEDGSGESNYANNCSCKWIISVPPGQRIRFTFEEMDTEGNIDFVYLADGKTAVPELIFAKFSGENLPPVVTSRTNEVLVWFVTDGKRTGKGWKFSYEGVK